jgi:HPt (histidine-containing phosphotransfer) domain-containing protein
MKKLSKQLPDFDLTYTSAILMNNADLYKELLFDFYEDNHRKLAEIESLIAQQDFKTAAELVHYIKGGAISIGATKLHHCAHQLELELRHAKCDADNLKRFQEAFQETMQTIQKIPPKTAS